MKNNLIATVQKALVINLFCNFHAQILFLEEQRCVFDLFKQKHSTAVSKLFAAVCNYKSWKTKALDVEKVKKKRDVSMTTKQKITKTKKKI